MAMLSRCAGFVRRWADGTFGVIRDRGRSDKPGQSVRTGDEMAPIARDVQSHLAFLEQEVSILRTHGCLQCEMLVHTSPVSHEHRLERHSLQTFARICVEEQTEFQAEVAF